VNARREPDCEHVKPYEHWGEMHSFEGSPHKQLNINISLPFYKTLDEIHSLMYG
jgi:hypothetical protein